MKRGRIKKISNKQQKLMNFRVFLKPIVFDAQGRRCKKCGGSSPDFRGWHLSHIVPLSQGGKDTIENYEVLCANCHALYRHNLKEKK